MSAGPQGGRELSVAATQVHDKAAVHATLGEDRPGRVVNVARGTIGPSHTRATQRHCKRCLDKTTGRSIHGEVLERNNGTRQTVCRSFVVRQRTLGVGSPQVFFGHLTMASALASTGWRTKTKARIGSHPVKSKAHQDGSGASNTLMLVHRQITRYEQLDQQWASQRKIGTPTGTPLSSRLTWGNWSLRAYPSGAQTGCERDRGANKSTTLRQSGRRIEALVNDIHEVLLLSY